MRHLFVIAWLLVLTTTLRAGGEKNIVPSTLRSATVYRTSAELVHTARATLSQGNNELVIDDISNSVDEGSIRVSCSGNVTIMSVAFSTEYLRPDATSPVVRRLQDSVLTLKKEQARLDILIRSNTDMLDLLSANKSIGGTAGVSLVELGKMMDYYKQKSLALRTEINEWKDRNSLVTGSIDRLQNQEKEEEKKNDKTGGRILLQLLSPAGGSCDLTVSYMTNTAFWTPFYDLRVDNANSPMHILYKAKLAQTSGLDWKKVKLSLSTSVPGQHGNAPVLKTWFLSFVNPVAIVSGYYKNNSNLLSNSLGFMSKTMADSGIPGAYSEVRLRGRNSIQTGEKEPLYVVNGVPMEAAEFKKIDTRAIKKMDVLKNGDETAIYGSRGAAGVILITLNDELGDYVSVSDNQMDVTFDIDLPYDVPGNGKEQGVVLKEYTVACNYRYYSAPRVDKDAYLLGGIAGWEKLNLLPGEANIIVEGAFIGKSFIDPSSIQDTLNLTLGRDKRVVVKKEKVVDYSSVKFLGSNKRQVFTYEITVKNNKKDSIQLLLKDQYPISSDKDIEEELLDSGGAEVNKDTGVLTWKLQMAAGESRKYRVSYSVKYPKDKIVNLN